MWDVVTTSTFDEWFAGVDEDVRVSVAARVQLLQTFGPQLKRPHADALYDEHLAKLKKKG